MMQPAALAVIKPTRVRRQHDAIERIDGRELIDVLGQVSTPWRVLPLLDAMERRGAITADMRAAGAAFHGRFRLAQLDGLRASSFMAGAGCGVYAANGNEAARRSVRMAIEALGGGRAPAASCVWNVVGLEWSLRRWSNEYRQGSTNEASGILIAALGVLARGDCS